MKMRVASYSVSAVVLGIVCGAAPVHARNFLCASVRIPIEQELLAFAAGVKRKDSTVGCFTMKDAVDRDKLLTIVDGEEDPIIADSQTVSFHPGQFLHLVTARFLGQERNLLENQAAVDQRDTAQVLFDAPIVGKGRKVPGTLVPGASGTGRRAGVLSDEGLENSGDIYENRRQG